jgi:hypothetical protein
MGVRAHLEVDLLLRIVDLHARKVAESGKKGYGWLRLLGSQS